MTNFTKILTLAKVGKIYGIHYDYHRESQSFIWGHSRVLITVGQGPIMLAVGAGWGGLDIFTLIYPFPSLSLSLGDGPI